MGDWTFAHLAGDSAGSCSTSDCRCGGRAPLGGTHPQPTGEGLWRSRQSRNFTGDVALRSFPRYWRGRLHRRPVAGLRSWRYRCPCSVGPVVSTPPVAYAVLRPGPGSSTWKLFATEALGMAVIIFLVGICLAVRRLAPLVPWVVGGLVGMGIALLGTTSGGSLNPARQFGPAVVSGQTDYLWVYLLAPMVGALIATWARQMIQSRRRVLSHRLCGTLGHPPVKMMGNQI